MQTEIILLPKFRFSFQIYNSRNIQSKYLYLFIQEEVFNFWKIKSMYVYFIMQL